MDDHAVKHFRRRKHQQTVEVEISFGAAASPFCTLGANADSAVTDADQSGIVCRPFRNNTLGLPFQLVQFIHGQSVFRGSLPRFQQGSSLRFDPVVMSVKESVYLSLCRPEGRTDGQTVGVDFNRKRSPPGAYDFYIHDSSQDL